MTAPGGGIGYYLWRAFTSPWNLLAVFGGAAAAMLTPWPDVLLPLVGAGEAIYLGGHVAAVNVYQLLISLGPDAQQRFNALKKRCLEMRSIASATRPTSVDGTT